MDRDITDARMRHLAGELLGEQMSDDELQLWADCRLTRVSLHAAIKAIIVALETNPIERGAG